LINQIAGRKGIFDVHLKSIVLENYRTVGAVASRLAALTPGFVGKIFHLSYQSASTNTTLWFSNVRCKFVN